MKILERKAVVTEAPRQTDDPWANEVALAAIWMDAEFPGWFRSVKPKDLDMQDCDRCVIGQTTGDGEVWRTLYGENRLFEYRRGFNGDEESPMCPFADQQAVPFWSSEIDKRLAVQ